MILEEVVEDVDILPILEQKRKERNIENYLKSKLSDIKDHFYQKKSIEHAFATLARLDQLNDF